MRYRIRHTTEYVYADPVDLASHMLHLTPRPLPGQRVLSAEVLVWPTPGRMTSGPDHFGNHVTWVFLDQSHQRFDATVEAEVEVDFASPPPADATPPWEDVVAAARRGGPGAWQAAEFSFDSPMAPADASAGLYVRQSFPPGRPVLQGLLELNARMRRDFAFRPGVTTVYTPVARVLLQRAGVCQDFTHVMISGLRALGLPARYVSGYLRTRPPPGQAPRRGADQSHAWVGAWLGPDHGWVDLDPTNDLVVRDEHVVLAWGRDYGDISPVRGVILGGGRHSVSVGVDLDAVA
ncbi:Transglutaminase family protein [Rhodovastum atsumiense]|uniref:Transglutaminase family protein n=1 Tax=Rhodovastum atsumiense TaxID=504468 RepID=A0A5M6ILA3_9PROT|nr:transglutaminase family protein [Rhodovastum atsumiense]KAA5609053.1 transglutaminase family protein [Rhodovastum atsumiense]CAH2604696.1 Transglutaminase family protein [Rhodovastum atsumiense]